MVQEPTYCLGIPGEATIEVSLNRLRTILGQVEAELYRSDIYENVLNGLSTLPEDMGTQVQRMVKAVGREAIRLALRKLVAKRNPASVRSPIVPSEKAAGTALPAPEPPERPVPLPPPVVSLNPTVTEALAISPSALSAEPPVQSSQPATPSSITPAVSNSDARSGNKLPKRLSKKEAATQAARQAWEDQLRALGQELRQVRQAKSLSSYHLHLKTQIPVHQLEALETGQIDRLPEDVYVRGFIRQIGNALGLNGVSMAASLPAIDPVKAILPTWYQPRLKTGLQLHSVHLYVGYAALMAGGLTWLSQQTAPKTFVKPSLIPEATLSPSPQPAGSDTRSESETSGAASSVHKAGGSSPVSIAPPEMHPF